MMAGKDRYRRAALFQRFVLVPGLSLLAGAGFSLLSAGRSGEAKRVRVMVYSPFLSEYSARLARSISDRCDVLLAVEKTDLRKSCEEGWFLNETRNFRVVEHSSGNLPRQAYWGTRLVLEALRFRPDILHVQEVDVVGATLAATLGRTVMTVDTVHDPAPHSGRDAGFFRDGQRFRDQIRAAARLFHVHGEYCRALLLRLEPGRPIIQTAHPVIHVPAAADLRAPEPGRILFFGRMEAYKGLDVLLDAVDLLRAQGLTFTLVLAGRGSELERLRDRTSASPDIEVLDGFLSPAEVIREFQRCAFVVAPYLDATQSGVTAGAIANGRAIVASAVGGLPEVVRDGLNGLLVPPGDARALADALGRMLREPELAEHLASGAASVRAQLDWSIAARTLVDAYEELVSARNVRRGAAAKRRARAA